MQPVCQRNWVQLYYRTKEPNAPEANDFYHVTAVPTADLGKTPQEAAEELVALTMAPSWYKQDRRMAEAGDCFTFNEEVWRFVEPEAICPTEVIMLFGFPFIAITRWEQPCAG